MESESLRRLGKIGVDAVENEAVFPMCMLPESTDNAVTEGGRDSTSSEREKGTSLRMTAGDTVKGTVTLVEDRFV